jgi:uncharacterized membrane protein
VPGALVEVKRGGGRPPAETEAYNSPAAVAAIKQYGGIIIVIVIIILIIVIVILINVIIMIIMTVMVAMIVNSAITLYSTKLTPSLSYDVVSAI